MTVLNYNHQATVRVYVTVFMSEEQLFVNLVVFINFLLNLRICRDKFRWDEKVKIVIVSEWHGWNIYGAKIDVIA